MRKSAAAIVGVAGGVDIWMVSPPNGAALGNETPHVHSGRYGRDELIEFAIESREPLRIHNGMTRRQREAVAEWIRDRKYELLDMWRTCKVRNLDKKGKRIGSRTYCLPWQVAEASFYQGCYLFTFADGTSASVPEKDMEEVAWGLPEALAKGDAEHGEFSIGGGGTLVDFGQHASASCEYIWYVYGKCGDWHDTEEYWAWYAKVMFEWSNSY